MLEYLPVPLIIIGSLFYARWKKAYLTQVMVIANFFIFAYVFFFMRIDYWLGRDILEAFAFQPSRFGELVSYPSIITSMFLHADPFHLIGNVLILYLIGLPLGERIGTKNWGIIYFVTGISATMLFYLFHGASNSYLLGASGAIYGLGGALLILYPRDRIPMLIGPIFSSRAPVWLAVGIMFVVETFLVSMAVNDGTAHIAHVGGMFCGILLAPILVKVIKESEDSELDFEMLRRMARTDSDNLMVDKIENETEADVRQAWLELYFQDAARCPNCKRILKEYKPKITCECGKSWKVRK